MAVYKKTYRPYDGPLTGAPSRLLVIPRYAFEDLRKSRFLSIFFFSSFIYPLICALLIWLEHNASALRVLGVGTQISKIITINATFFLSLLGWQSMLALFLAAFVGPGRVSPDLTNGGLSLYLARPFSRVEYVVGKMLVLLILLSLMTWVPGLLLFGLEGYLEGWSWISTNMRLATGMFFSAWIWIVLICLLALALSAWVKWKPAAGALMFGIFFVAAGFGAAINVVQNTKWGHLLQVSNVVGTVWVWLFEGDNPTTNGAVFFRMTPGEELPLWSCWLVLIFIAWACLYMLGRKIRGAEVVR
ncbi:MAG TPA: ABC transporter permease subunit [Verrucomicrobiae bacterium]|nr:ABC transporter permease subunit [Verrucomicrobiae bacterium]